MASKLDFKLVDPVRYEQWTTALKYQTYPEESLNSTEHSDLELGVDLTQLKKWKASLEKLDVHKLEKDIKELMHFVCMRVRMVLTLL